MKQILFIAALILCSKCLFSQDTIVLANHDIVIAKILEIAPTTIKYKRFDMPEGPDYIEDINNVSRITYKNGKTETVKHYAAAPMPFSPKPLYVPNAKFIHSARYYTYNDNVVSENQMYRIMISRNDLDLNRVIHRSKNNKVGSFMCFAAIPFAIYSAEFFLLSMDDYRPNYLFPGALGIAAVGCLSTGIICTVKHKQLKRKAVQLFNEKY
jgi:hypothetical protein